MAEETTVTSETTNQPFDSADSMDTVHDTMSQLLAAGDVEAVYGEPIKNGDTYVIPAAEVLSGAAFGFGQGRGNEGSGGGGGGGGRVFSRPVAAIVLTPDGAYVEPVIDVTKLALAGVTAAGFMLSLLMRMRRGRR